MGTSKQRERRAKQASRSSGIVIDSFLQLCKRPLNLLLNIALIAIAISIPTLLDLSVSNLKKWAGYNDNNLEITLYLINSYDGTAGNRLAEQVRAWPGVEQVDFISSEQSLENLKSVDLFGQALEGLIDNPLPASIVIHLPQDSRVAELAEELIAKAEQTEGVDWVMFDMEWFDKAAAIIDIGNRLNAVLSAFLSLSVCLVIGNCVRMTIDSKREEILVSKLVGATNAYVRKPFLFMGMWVGVLGAGLGLLLCSLAWVSLGKQLGPLGLAYGSPISLIGLDVLTALAILASCALFGLIGAWLICNRQLNKITPQ